MDHEVFPLISDSDASKENCGSVVGRLRWGAPRPHDAAISISTWKILGWSCTWTALRRCFLKTLACLNPTVKEKTEEIHSGPCSWPGCCCHLSWALASPSQAHHTLERTNTLRVMDWMTSSSSSSTLPLLGVSITGDGPIKLFLPAQRNVCPAECPICLFTSPECHSYSVLCLSQGHILHILIVLLHSSELSSTESDIKMWGKGKQQGKNMNTEEFWWGNWTLWMFIPLTVGSGQSSWPIVHVGFFGTQLAPPHPKSSFHGRPAKLPKLTLSTFGGVNQLIWLDYDWVDYSAFLLLLIFFFLNSLFLILNQFAGILWWHNPLCWLFLLIIQGLL